MADQRARGLKRMIEMVVAPLRATVNSMIEVVSVSGTTAGAGAVPTATSSGEELQIYEPYGFASAAPGETLAFSPNGDDDDRVALPVSNVTGRPATDSLDAFMWTRGGHQIHLDNDGKITITAAALADIDIIVDNGQTVNVGDALAAALLKAQATENYLIAAANGVTGTPDVEAGFAAFALALQGLANAAATTKAKGT